MCISGVDGDEDDDFCYHHYHHNLCTSDGYDDGRDYDNGSTSWHEVNCQ